MNKVKNHALKYTMQNQLQEIIFVVKNTTGKTVKNNNEKLLKQNPLKIHV